MEYFRERINSTQEWKMKAETNLEGVYKGREGERRKRENCGHTENLELRAI